MNHAYDVSHLLAGLMLVASFALLYQDRIFAVLNIFAAQAILLSMAVGWEAWTQQRPHLFITAALALCLKGIIIPVALHKMIVRLGVHRDVEQVVGVGKTLLLGLALTSLSLMLVLKITAAAESFTREGLALALAIILLGMLMMITRRNAVTQIVGFMSLENGLILAATGRARHAAGRRDQRRLLGAHRAFRFCRVCVPYPRTLRQCRHRGPRKRQGRHQMMTSVALVIGIPFVSAAVLVLVPGYRVSAAGNVLAMFATFLAGVSLLFVDAGASSYIIVDDMNILFIILNTLVGLYHRRCSAPATSATRSKPANSRRCSCDSIMPCSLG